MQALAVLIALACSLLILTSASGKDFHPGDLRICNVKRCVAVVKRDLMPKVDSLFYGRHAPTPVRSPVLGAPYYKLRFRNGYVSGIVATKRLDRFLSYGVVLGRFVPRRWYAVPHELAAEFRRLTANLSPIHLTRAAIAKSR